MRAPLFQDGQEYPQAPPLILMWIKALRSKLANSELTVCGQNRYNPRVLQ